MSPEIIEHEEGAEGAPPTAPAKKSKKKLIIIGAAAAVLLLGGGGAGYMFMGGSKPAEEHGEAAPKEKAHGEGKEGEEAFVDVPAFVVNLRSPDGTARFLKVHFMVVPGEKGSSEAITAKLPLLLDAYQPFLRELRPEDLSGSAAVFRIKEELMRRANETLGKDVIADVLIQDLVQQ